MKSPVDHESEPSSSGTAPEAAADRPLGRPDGAPLPAVHSARCAELREHLMSGAVPVREVRLALTMVGGTSLAIYENGVAQELFRMVHGQGLYGLLKRITHSHAYVDIMSGT